MFRAGSRAVRFLLPVGCVRSLVVLSKQRLKASEENRNGFVSK